MNDYKCLMMVDVDFRNKIINGGDAINKRNYDLLCSYFDHVDIKVSRKDTNVGTSSKLLMYAKYVFHMIMSDNYKDNVKFLKTVLKRKKYDVIYIGYSSCGKYAEIIKTYDKNIKVVTFFHNVEYDYWNSQANFNKYKVYLASYISKINEKKAMQYSDVVIALNERDSNRLSELYGRKADLLLPTSFLDTENRHTLEMISKKKNAVNKLLFIGSDFYPNKHGITWFIEKVLPSLKNVELVIVGRGTEKWKECFDKYSAVKIYGGVENIQSYYYEADAVIAPIFLGSGMKTKTAEALMFGKYIFGTQEAFEGYDITYSKVGALCNTEQEFIDSINRFIETYNGRYNEYSRKVFEEKYTMDGSKILFDNVIKMLNL